MPPKPAQRVSASSFQKSLLAPSWGLPQILNFVTQTGSNTDQHALLKSFVAGGQSWEGACAALATAPDAVFNLSLAWPTLPKSSLEQARTLARSVKVAIECGFSWASEGLMAALLVAVQRWLADGVSPAECLDRCIRAMLSMSVLARKLQGADRVHNLSASALHCAACVLVDWARHQRNIVPNVPPSAIASDGLLEWLGRKLEDVPETGETKAGWRMAAQAAGEIVQHLGSSSGDEVVEAVMTQLAPSMLRALRWTGLQPAERLTDAKGWQVVGSLICAADSAWFGLLDESYADLVGQQDGVMRGVATLAHQLAEIYMLWCGVGIPLSAVCSLSDVNSKLLTCMAAMTAWATQGEELDEFCEKGMPAIIAIVKCYATYFAANPESAGHTHGLNPRSAVKLGTKLLGMVCKDDDDVVYAFGQHGGVAVFLSALRAMESVRVVCEDPNPERLTIMKQLLSVLEMALDNCMENQERFLAEGGVQDVLSLAVLDISARQEVLLRASNSKMLAGTRFSAGLRSCMSVVATLVQYGAELVSTSDWNRGMAEAVCEVASVNDLVRLLLWEPAPPGLLEGDYDPDAPSYFSLHDSALMLAVLLATLMPDECDMLGLTESVGHQEGLLKVGRAVLSACSMRGCGSVMCLLSAMARCAVGVNSKLGLAFFRQRLTLSLVADLIKAAAVRAEILARDPRSSVGVEGEVLPVLVYGSNLLGVLTKQQGEGGGELCSVVCDGCISVLNQALPPVRDKITKAGGVAAPKWLNLLEVLAEVATAAILRRNRWREEQKKGLQQKESEAARIAAELLAEEEAEKQKAEAVQQRKKEKKAARKAAKKASVGDVSSEGPSAGPSAPQSQQAAQQAQQMDPEAQQVEPNEPQLWEGDAAPPSQGQAGSGSLSGFSLLQQGAREGSGAPNGLAVLLAAPPQSPTITGRVGLLEFGQQQAALPPEQASGSGQQGGAAAASGSGGGKKSKKKGKGKGKGTAAQQQEQTQGSGRPADSVQSGGSSTATARLPESSSQQQQQPMQRQPVEQQQQQQGGNGSSDSGLQLPAREWFMAEELSHALVPAGPPPPNPPEAPGTSWLQSAEVHEPAVAEQEAEFRELLSHLLPGISMSPPRPSGFPPAPAHQPAMAPMAAPASSSMPYAGSSGGAAAGGPAGPSGAAVQASGSGSGSSSSSTKLVRLRSALVCPLTGQQLVDPVILQDGMSYERAAVAGIPEGAAARPNYALRQLLESLQG